MTKPLKFIYFSLTVLAVSGFAACSSKPENMTVVKRSSSIVALDKESTELIGGDRGYLITTRKADEKLVDSQLRDMAKQPEPKTIAIQKSSIIENREPDIDELKQLESGVNNSKYLYYSQNSFRVKRIRLKRFK